MSAAASFACGTRAAAAACAPRSPAGWRTTSAVKCAGFKAGGDPKRIEKGKVLSVGRKQHSLRVQRQHHCVLVRAQEIDTEGAEAETDEQGTHPLVTEVTKDSFYPTLSSMTETLLVVDCYTQWCGPCAALFPRVVELAKKYEGSVKFVKLNCNQENKELAKGFGVRSVPTFFLFKGQEKVAGFTGMKDFPLIETSITELL